LIEGYAPIAGSKMFQLMAALIELHCEDRAAGRKPNNYRTIKASELADRLALSDEEGVRQTVSRIRRDLAEGCVAFSRPPFASNQLIENVREKGYRINPMTVRVVALGEILSE
jgi:hypothetical protein